MLLVLLVGVAPVSAVSPSVIMSHDDTGFSYSGTHAGTFTGPPVPAGTWWVSMTGELDTTHSAASTGETQCQLIDGVSSAVIDSAVWLPDYGQLNGRADLSILLSGVHTASVSWHPDVVCQTKGSTASGQVSFVRISAVSGSLTTSGGPRFKTATAGTQTVAGDGNFHPVESIVLPAGRWTILGKALVRNPSLSVTVNVTCRLKPSSADTDATTLSLAKGNGSAGSEGEIGVQVAHSFGSSTTLNLSCRGDSAGGFGVKSAELIAVKAGKLTRGPIGGSTTTSGSGTPAVISGFHSGTVTIPVSSSLVTLARISLPAGKWYVTAKAVLHGSDMLIECHLANEEGGGFLDDTFARGDPGGSTGLYMHNPVDEASAVHEGLQCKSNAAGASFTNIRITAVQASSVAWVFVTH